MVVGRNGRRIGGRVQGVVAREETRGLGGSRRHGDKHRRRTHVGRTDYSIVPVEIGDRHNGSCRSTRRQTACQVTAVGQVKVQTLERREVAARRITAQVLAEALRVEVGDDATRRTRAGVRVQSLDGHRHSRC